MRWWDLVCVSTRERNQFSSVLIDGAAFSNGSPALSVDGAASCAAVQETGACRLLAHARGPAVAGIVVDEELPRSNRCFARAAHRRRVSIPRAGWDNLLSGFAAMVRSYR